MKYPDYENEKSLSSDKLNEANYGRNIFAGKPLGERKVIAINSEGLKKEIDLDLVLGARHASSIIEFSKSFGHSINKTTSPHEAALEASSKGILVLLFLGKFCVIYLPNNLTVMQYDKLSEEMISFENFIFNIVHNNNIKEDKDLTYVYEYIDSIKPHTI